MGRFGIIFGLKDFGLSEARKQVLITEDQYKCEFNKFICMLTPENPDSENRLKTDVFRLESDLIRKNSCTCSISKITGIKVNMSLCQRFKGYGKKN